MHIYNKIYALYLITILYIHMCENVYTHIFGIIESRKCSAFGKNIHFRRLCIQFSS